MSKFLTREDFTLQTLNLNSPKINKNAACSAILIKANWCGFCVKYFPIFDEMSSSYKNVNFLVVESDSNENMLKQWSDLVCPAYKVDSFPTVVLYGPDGNYIKTINRDDLKKELDSVMM